MIKIRDNKNVVLFKATAIQMKAMCTNDLKVKMDLLKDRPVVSVSFEFHENASAKDVMFDFENINPDKLKLIDVIVF